MRLITNEELGCISGAASQIVEVRATRMTDAEKAQYDQDYNNAYEQCIQRSDMAGGAFFSYTTKISTAACDAGAGNISAQASLACGVIYDQKNLLEKNDGNGNQTMCQIEATALVSVDTRRSGAIK